MAAKHGDERLIREMGDKVEVAWLSIEVSG